MMVYQMRCVGHAATNPEVRSSRSLFSPMILQSAKSLAGWIRPQNQEDHQPLNFRTPLGERSMDPVGGPGLILNYTYNIPHVRTVSDKRVSGRRYDQVLIRGSLVPLRASLRKVRIEDLFHRLRNVLNLRRYGSVPDQGQRGTVAHYAGSTQKYVRTQSVHTY